MRINILNSAVRWHWNVIERSVKEKTFLSIDANDLMLELAIKQLNHCFFSNFRFSTSKLNQRTKFSKKCNRIALKTCNRNNITFNTKHLFIIFIRKWTYKEIEILQHIRNGELYFRFNFLWKQVHWPNCWKPWTRHSQKWHFHIDHLQLLFRNASAMTFLLNVDTLQSGFFDSY